MGLSGRLLRERLGQVTHADGGQGGFRQEELGRGHGEQGDEREDYALEDKPFRHNRGFRVAILPPIRISPYLRYEVRTVTNQ